MGFKFFQGKSNLFLELGPTQILTLTRPTFTPENVEFCFQFGNNEPVVFATGPNECSIHLSPNSSTEMSFTDNNNVFKLFARQIQND
jgi:hypothetical protein